MTQTERGAERTEPDAGRREWARLDPITFEVLKNSVDAIVDEMALTTLRTAFSPSIRDGMDFSATLCDAQGNVLGQGVSPSLHIGAMPDAMAGVFKKFGEDMRPGDVFMMNDPYTGGMHLPDIYLFKPVFHGDRRIAFLVVVGDQVDIGGRVPGGRAVDSTEIYQEGLRLPPVRLYDGGVANQAIWDIVEANVRISHKVLGDLRSMLAALYVAEPALHALIDKYGLETILSFFAETLDYSERLARQRIRALPDGHWEFEDYIDDDSISDNPIRIKVALDIRGDEMHFDLTGSSPQVKGAINSTLSYVKSAIYSSVRPLMPPEIPTNSGYFRTIKVHAPPGTIVNPLPPAPVAQRGLTGFRVADATQGVLAQVVPDQVGAAGEGGTSVFRLGGHDPERGGWVCWDSIQGTWGGRPGMDGHDGCSSSIANSTNIPVEMIESDLPVRINEYGFQADSGGPGEFRGGLGLIREWELLGEEGVLTMRSDRRKFRPWGAKGGEPGAPSLNFLNPAAENRPMPSKIVFRIERGTVFRHLQASGGGYGDPLDRDPEAVWWDWRDGKVTAQHARDAYGVVIDVDRRLVDQEATVIRREELRRQRGATAPTGDDQRSES